MNKISKQSLGFLKKILGEDIIESINTKKMEILLLEDNAADAALIKKYLEKTADFDFNLESYPLLSEGLDRLKIKDFDIILLDLKLRDSDRESTLESVLRGVNTIPIVILTGLDDKKLALKSLQKGAQDYIVKNELNGPNLIRSILFAKERFRSERRETPKEYPILKIDDKDKEILNYLQKNYKISYKDLSKKVGLAASTIHNRVRNMLDNGIIIKIDTVVDPLKVGYDIIAILGINTDPLKLEVIAKKLVKFRNIQLVASSTGEFNLIVKVIAKNEKELWKVINEEIKTLEGIEKPIQVSNFIEVYKSSQIINFKV
jgi:DNA-binding Lrp family transcriptional regulator